MSGEGWRSRGYLPHWEAGEVAQAITFRLADSLPSAVLAKLRDELRAMAEDEAGVERRRRIERLLDQGHGAALLADERIGRIVEQAFLHFDCERYKLHAWVIMPNHAHVVATPVGKHSLADIVHSWKSFTAREANRILGRTGPFWSREYHDRFIRDAAHFANAVSYVAMNPVKAGLCKRPEAWRFSSAWSERPGSAGF
jgi:putative DNA methylase